ncbi:hypothetical protein F3Y22_tig00113719pilonHSYRG00142 [Hibiscus syriacus]|uniref:Trehalose 6-phosphate phosphatase n=1 Tax=Hibiscus syriacus TaxID=106335 RepID=A0A6A2X1F6_HIBSY|nr:hypothetical protein F3Y22_tig00113719pilonHSYRG00142 [Hibiscus syriacus]
MGFQLSHCSKQKKVKPFYGPDKDDDNGYASWPVKHPSALETFDSISKEAKGKKVVVFLDYDGTLSPIVEDPDKAFMSSEMRMAVREVAKYFPTSIISGRSREKVKEFVQVTNVYYGGSHGLDILAPLRAVKSFDKKISIEVEDTITEIQGARLEDNKFCISVHYRQVPPKDHDYLKEKVISLVENRPEFRLTEGKMVLEVRPSILRNKGDALNYLLDTLGFKDAKDVLLCTSEMIERTKMHSGLIHFP